MTAQESFSDRRGPEAQRLIRPESEGTAERLWASWYRSLPAMPLPSGHVVVVAAHPDDETLGAGGLIAETVLAGGHVSVVVCTDGEAADSTPDLASRRVQELERAMHVLAGGAVSVHRLELPDGGLADNVSELRQQLRLWTVTADMLVAPWMNDGHTDHDTVGAVCSQMCGESGQTLWAAPVWAWHWASPEIFDGLQMHNIELSAVAQERKRAALSCYHSQIGAGDQAILSPSVLRHFGRPVETFVSVQ